MSEKCIYYNFRLFKCNTNAIDPSIRLARYKLAHICLT